MTPFSLTSFKETLLPSTKISSGSIIPKILNVLIPALRKFSLIAHSWKASSFPKSPQYPSRCAPISIDGVVEPIPLRSTSRKK